MMKKYCNVGKKSRRTIVVPSNMNTFFNEGHGCHHNVCFVVRSCFRQQSRLSLHFESHVALSFTPVTILLHSGNLNLQISTSPVTSRFFHRDSAITGVTRL